MKCNFYYKEPYRVVYFLKVSTKISNLANMHAREKGISFICRVDMPKKLIRNTCVTTGVNFYKYFWDLEF